MENDLAVKTVGSLLLYVKKTQKRALRHLQGITVYEANEYMVLDVYARRNLELTETIRDKNVKDRCCRSWITQRRRWGGDC